MNDFVFDVENSVANNLVASHTEMRKKFHCYGRLSRKFHLNVFFSLPKAIKIGFAKRESEKEFVVFTKRFAGTMKQHQLKAM
jgi:hypothetical protein